MTMIDYTKNHWLRHEKNAIMVFGDVVHVFSSDGALEMVFANKFNIFSHVVRWEHMMEVEEKTLLLEAQEQEFLILDKTMLLEKIKIRPTWASSNGIDYVSWKDDEL